MYHHQDYIHTEQTLSAKDVLRAGRQEDKHTGSVSRILDKQAHKEPINVHITGTNSVILNYYSWTFTPRCTQELVVLHLQLAG